MRSKVFKTQMEGGVIVSKDLYFLPILSRALVHPDPKSALKIAFAQIELLGNQPHYRRGFLQFEAFLGVVSARLELWQAENISDLIVELATGLTGLDQGERQAALEIITGYPGGQVDYRSLCEILDARLGANKLSVLELYHEQARIGLIPLTGLAASETIADIEPGRYLIKLGTGLVIWSGMFSAQDLLWTEAFGRRGLSLAAETEDSRQKPTRQEILLDGEVILRIYAGLEKGCIEVELKGAD